MVVFRSLAPTSIPAAVRRAIALGLMSTALAWVGAWLHPGVFTSLDWSLYDAWMAGRSSPATAEAVVVVYRDGVSDARHGAGTWDRAILASAIRTLDAAGASSIGLLTSLDGPSPPHLGGAASDVLLAEAIETSDKVVIAWSPRDLGLHTNGDHAHPLPLVARRGGRGGHLVVTRDDDRVVRRVPAVIDRDGQRLPAFGLAVASVARPLETAAAVRDAVASFDLVEPSHADSIDSSGWAPGGGRGLLINFVGQPATRAFFSLPFSRMWEAIEAQQRPRLERWVTGKIVVLLLDPPGIPRTASSARQSLTATIQLSLLNSVLTGQWLREPPRALSGLLMVALSSLAAWSLFSAAGWRGLAGVGGLVGGFLLVTIVSLLGAGLVVPVFTPLLGLVLSAAGAVSWSYLRASPRMRQLEDERDLVRHELAQAREAVAGREAVVEALEEDLDSARAAQAHSTGKEVELVRAVEVLQERCAEALAGERAARRCVEELEARLAGLRAVNPEAEGRRSGRHERLRREGERLGITTQDEKVLALLADVQKVAKLSLPVLILGEPGTGKELFARAVHQLSPRAAHPFIAVNMAAISAELFESELFGHVRGSFTGAVADRRGYFESAHGGTIFLDEIGDLPYELQGKLLRVLQEQSFYRVGASHPTRVDVRVVAATNKPLQREIAAGVFREDLYYRLQGLVLRLPALRERRGDLPLLARQFVQEAAQEVGRPLIGLSREALALLESQPWKGNIRELQQCLRQAVALADGTVITRDDLRVCSPEPEALVVDERVTGPGADPRSDEAVLACLRECHFDMQATAGALSCDRGTVTQRLKGLGFRALVDTRGDLARAAVLLAGDPTLAPRVEGKLREYYQHLLRAIGPFASAGPAIMACRRRFKNLPDRHFKAVQLLIQHYFDRSPGPHSGLR